MRKHISSCIAIFLLAFTGLYMYAGMVSSNVGIREIMADYHAKTELANGWLFGKEFTEDDVAALEKIKGVQKTQLRIGLPLESKSGDPITLYLEDENKVTKPYLIKGVPYDPKATEGIWLNSRYAEENKLSVGDKFTLYYGSFKTEQPIKGLIMTPEYEYYKAESDTNVDFSDIGYAYMPRAAFPEKEYTEAATGYPVDLCWNQIAFTSSVKVMSLQKEIDKELPHKYTSLLNRKSFSGIDMLDKELEQHDMFADVFPLVFLLIALLSIMITENRLINDQRRQIGTLKALGMSRGKIMGGYISMSMILTAAGAALGSVVGPASLGKLFDDFMPTEYTLPTWTHGYSVKFVYATLMMTAVGGLVAYLSCRKLVNENTAAVLYPRSDEKAKHCIFEKLPNWKHLSFSTQYCLRDISRSKMRSIMVLIGITGGALLTVGGFGSGDTLTDLDHWVFDQLNPYAYRMDLKKSTSAENADRIAADTDGELVMFGSAEIEGNKKTKDNYVTTVTVTGNKNIYGVTDKNKKRIELKEGEVALTKRLAEKYGIEPGDTLKWHAVGSDKETESVIKYITRNPNIIGITIGRKDFEEAGYTFKPNMCVTDKDVSGYKNDSVKAIHGRSDLRSAWDADMDAYYTMIYYFVGLALLLTVIVIYNSGALSFNERKKEFAILKVQGFSDKQLRKILIRENLWLTVIGVLIGSPFGRLTLQAMFDSNGEEVDYEVMVYWKSYLLSAAAVIGTSLIVSYIFSSKMKKVDMAETLKPSE